MAQVELTQIVAKYKEELSDSIHKNLCYKLAIAQLELELDSLKAEVATLEKRLDEFGEIEDPDPYPPHEYGLE